LFYNVAFLLLLASPISFAYAFTRYRLLEVEARLRRGTRFVIYTGGLLAAFFGVLYLISQILLHTFHIENQTPTLAVALLLALGFAPVHRKLRKLIERKFYPERIKLRRMLHEFLTGTSAMPDRATLWAKLEENMKQGLGIDIVYPILRDSNQETFRLPNGEQVPIDPNGALLLELEKNSRALMCDECIAFDGLTITQSEHSWFTCNKVAVMLPMIVQSRLIGMLGIKFQDDHEGMESQDLDILNSLASQIALQSENLRLLEENFDKRRLEEELTNARQVQQGFLPGTLPKTPGLTVAARFLSSFEVAGDYYDVIPLKDNRTLIAVSDVSGKGAGAAMIMATVQASLRSMAKVKISLKDAISSINDLMCLNTNPEQFVTFFTAVLDPPHKKLTYINAGHNHPRIIRTDGSIVELNAGGPVLGVLENAEYHEETLSIQDGDLLIAFTDGVSEAMNAKGEEFGEHRIVEFIHPIVNESPAAILEKLEFEVTTFRGSQPLEDDFTILLVKAGNHTITSTFN
jgi:sigma-B regulation protein RsbU (phosphoserine phosphatase)